MGSVDRDRLVTNLQAAGIHFYPVKEAHSSETYRGYSLTYLEGKRPIPQDLNPERALGVLREWDKVIETERVSMTGMQG